MGNYKTTKAELKEFHTKKEILDDLIQCLHDDDKKRRQERVLRVLQQNENVRELLKERARERRLNARAGAILDMSSHPDWPSAVSSNTVNSAITLCMFLCIEVLPRAEHDVFTPSQSRTSDPLNFLN